MGYRLYTDNLLHYRGEVPVSAFTGQWQAYLSPGRDLTLIPALSARWLTGGAGRYGFALGNLLGGNRGGRYLPQQLPFVGIHKAEEVENMLLTASLQMRQRLWKNNYLLLTGNYARIAERPCDLFRGREAHGLFGMGVGYMYNSFLGPLEVQFSWSNRTKQVSWYAGVGFFF